MKIWIISQYFKPEFGPAQSRIYGFAKRWLKDGHNVTIFSAIPHHNYKKANSNANYDHQPNIFEDSYNDLPIIRHKTSQVDPTKFISRFKTQLSFAFKLMTHYFSDKYVKENPEVVIATSPSIMCCLVGYFIARKNNAKFIFEVRNLLPDAYIASRIITNKSIYAKVLDYISTFLYKNADAIVVLSVSMAKALHYRGVDKSKIFLIYDGIDEEFINKADRTNNTLKATSIRNRMQIHPLTKIVTFLGTHSSKQGLGQIIEAAKLLLSRNDIIFLMVGDGDDKSRLMNMAKGMPNIKFVDTSTDEDTLGYYACSDILLIPHRDSTDINLHIPLEMFEILATKTPSIACVSGEAKSILIQSDACTITRPEKPAELAESIVNVFENYETAKLKAQNGPAFVLEKFKRSILAKQYIAVANKVKNQNEI